MSNPDIGAILAALAAQQRPAATPSAPAQAPAYAPAPGPSAPTYPVQSSTPAAGGYGLPQPLNSGTFDINSVRPVNTGSVSIADAIAKAKAIAESRAPPAGSAPRDDPRLAGRGGRDRSRSPVRRDQGDSYREDRRYGRDRSNSPGRRGQGFSPRGASNETGSETITVRSSHVGLIIGRAGENLKRVEQETGARVQFIQPSEPGAQMRQCTLMGTFQAREAAKREIAAVAEKDNHNPDGQFGGRQGPPLDRSSQQPALRDGETTRQILVPDKTVGLIIGRGGETIRDLQERSGCHVNIVAENKSINGQRPVNLIGNKQASDKAEAMIWEIVDSDTRLAEQGQGRGPSGGGPPAGGRGFEQPQYGQHSMMGAGVGAAVGGGGKVNESIKVPSEAVGMIIGKGGEAIKEMQNTTGCKINVSQPIQPDIERNIDLVGTYGAIEAAKRAIWDKVETVVSRPDRSLAQRE